MSSTPSTPRTFTQLGRDVHVSYAPATSTLPISNDRPSLIIICGWMDAQLPHVLKYAQGYDALFPDAAILIVRSRSGFFFSSHANRLKSVAPAVKLLKEHVDLDASPPPRILVHTFSNGGCFQFSTALQSLASETSTASSPILPAQLLLFDSSPGTLTLTNFTRAFSAVINNTLLRFLFQVFLTGVYVVWYTLLKSISFLGLLFTGRHSVDLFNAMLNNLLSPALLPKDAPRMFIYSKNDKLVHWRDVEGFADRCEHEGLKVVRERYEKTGHVNHLKGEGEGGKERYWNAIKSAWNATR